MTRGPDPQECLGPNHSRIERELPQIQPAERLWPLTNEPIVNEYFETLEELDEVLAERCRILADDQDQIRAHTLFEWWPQYN